MVNFRIQELAEAKGLTLEELSQISGVAVGRIQTYTNTSFIPVEITEESATELRKIAVKLNVPIMDLIKPVPKSAAFKLNILEIAQQKGISFKELSERSGIHPTLLSFYITQPISKDKLTEPPFQTHINKISDILGCSPEDLKIASELPITRIRLEEFAKERGITLEDLKLLSGLPTEFIDLIATQPIDIQVWMQKKIDSEIIKSSCCALCDFTHGQIGCDCCDR